MRKGLLRAMWYAYWPWSRPAWPLKYGEAGVMVPDPTDGPEEEARRAGRDIATASGEDLLIEAVQIFSALEDPLCVGSDRRWFMRRSHLISRAFRARSAAAGAARSRSGDGSRASPVP